MYVVLLVEIYGVTLKPQKLIKRYLFSLKALLVVRIM